MPCARNIRMARKGHAEDGLPLEEPICGQRIPPEHFIFERLRREDLFPLVVIDHIHNPSLAGENTVDLPPVFNPAADFPFLAHTGSASFVPEINEPILRNAQTGVNGFEVFKTSSDHEPASERTARSMGCLAFCPNSTRLKPWRNE